jgi:flagellar motor protein MotB
MADSLEKLNDAANILQKADVTGIITALSLGIAKAQEQLDDNSIRQLVKLSEQEVAGKSLLELGFVPAFYQFEYADVSASIHLQMQLSESVDFSLGIDLDYAKNKGYSKEEVELIEKSKEDEHRKEFKSSRSVIMRVSESKAVKIQNKTVAMDQTKTAVKMVEDFIDQVHQAESVDRVTKKLSSTRNLSNLVTSDGVWLNYNNGFISLYAPKTDVKKGVLQILDYNPTSTQTFAITSSTNLHITNSSTASAVSSAALALTGGLGANGKVVVLPFKSNPAYEVVVYFAHDRDTVDFNYSEGAYNNTGLADKVSAIGSILESSPSVKFSIAGHTDSSGEDAYNNDLSERRNKSVLALFASKFENTQLFKSANGEQEAIANNGPNATRDPKFRKVVIKLTTTPTDYYYFQGENFVTPTLLNPLPSSVNGFIYKLDLGTANSTISFDYGDLNVSLSSISGSQNLYTQVSDSTFQEKWKAEKVEDTIYLLHKDTKIEYTAYNSESKEIVMEEVRTGNAADVQNSSSIVIDKTVNSDYYLKKDAEKTENPSSLAVGLNVDIRTSKAFSISMEGSASVSARLRALPPPQEFRAYITSLNTNA